MYNCFTINLIASNLISIDKKYKIIPTTICNMAVTVIYTAAMDSDCECCKKILPLNELIFKYTYIQKVKSQSYDS